MRGERACSPGRDAPGRAGKSAVCSRHTSYIRQLIYVDIRARATRRDTIRAGRNKAFMVNMRIALPFTSDLFRARAHYFVNVGLLHWRRDDLGPRARTWRAGCRSAMHKRALSKDYDYFIALYARVVKFTCHFNNWLPADAGPCSGRVSGERWSRDGGESARPARGPKGGWFLIDK